MGRQGPQAHAPQGDRTGEFVLLADHLVDNSVGNPSRMPLAFGGDWRTFGRIEFASFAMLAMPRRRSGPGAYATRLGKVADFRFGAPPGAQFVTRSYF
jgi:hypothetical protein